MNANHPANVKIIYSDAAWNPLSCDCGLGSFIQASTGGCIRQGFDSRAHAASP
ncbi:hypothetical protein F2Q68_00032228 [Brassica cretica]|uniref:Uncharacterized protein n=1 Tax=Brassica cretica TaxID=69181 RepID=A0A8S9G6H3_BRACR|nr:hypothetical protein F2Q68_00032228 [Brassica cretica]